MRGRFSAKIDTPVPDDDPNGAEATLLVWGLATVSTDVAIDLHVGHPRPSDLVVTLVNPAGTEVTVVDGSAAGAELYLDGKPLAGFPGDESANGVWRLRVRDGKKGKTGTAYSFGLTVTSRWD
jgi:subtilisin-like proprotein convertase family protein